MNLYFSHWFFFVSLLSSFLFFSLTVYMNSHKILNKLVFWINNRCSAKWIIIIVFVYSRETLPKRKIEHDLTKIGIDHIFVVIASIKKNAVVFVIFFLNLNIKLYKYRWLKKKKQIGYFINDISYKDCPHRGNITFHMRITPLNEEEKKTLSKIN